MASKTTDIALWYGAKHILIYWTV